MKKYLSYILILIVFIEFLSPIKIGVVHAQGSPTPTTPSQTTTSSGTVLTSNGTQKVPSYKGICVSNGQTYTGWDKNSCTTNSTNAYWTPYYYLLAPLPGLGKTDGIGSFFDPTGNGNQTTSLGTYLNPMISIFIGICAVLAVIMILWGGIEYMGSELISSKEAGKERIRNAIFGLLLALGAWTLLNTINPNLLNSDISTPNANITSLGSESTGPFIPLNDKTIQGAGISGCTGSGGKDATTSIAQSFVGNTNYTQDSSIRNTFSGTTYNGDCSSFVDQVYACAGLPNPGANTAAIFQNQNSHDINGKTFDYSTLHPGDLVGWPPENDPGGNGHVMMYIGNGQVIDNQPSGTQVRQISNYASRITSVTSP